MSAQARLASDARLPPGAKPSPAFARRSGEAAARPVNIVADVHEARSGIPEGLAALGASVRAANLRSGDYILSGGTVVERKRVMDLHTAVGNGRFWPQMLKLLDSAAHPYLLVEGTDIDRGPLHPASVRSILLAVMAKGVPVLRSYQQKDSAIWIYRLAVSRQRPRRRHDRPAYAQLPSRKRPVDSGEALLAAVPGVSVALARALLARFESVGALIEAGPDRWSEVPGIGPARVRSLEQALRSGGGERSAS